MRVIGITGGSGSGKSSICNALAAIGYTIIDADKIAREIVAPGQPALGELTEVFGAEILLQDGALNRKMLAKLAFSDAAKLAVLNKITHKYITDTVKKRIESCTSANCVIDAPLLYESKLDLLCDTIIGITATREIRTQRIIKRDGLTAEEANRRLDAQFGIEDNIKKADLCMDTSLNPAPELLARKIDTFIKGVSDETV